MRRCSVVLVPWICGPLGRRGPVDRRDAGDRLYNQSLSRRRLRRTKFNAGLTSIAATLSFVFVEGERADCANDPRGVGNLFFPYGNGAVP